MKRHSYMTVYRPEDGDIVITYTKKDNSPIRVFFDQVVNGEKHRMVVDEFGKIAECYGYTVDMVNLVLTFFRNSIDLIQNDVYGRW